MDTNGNNNNQGIIIEDIKGKKKYFFDLNRLPNALNIYFKYTKKYYENDRTFEVDDKDYNDIKIDLERSASEVKNK